MRNLSVIARTVSRVPEPWGDLRAICTDLDEKVNYGASVSTFDGSSNSLVVTIWKVSATSLDPERIVEFPTEIPKSSATPHIISLHVIAETRKLCAILGSGDICVVPIDDAAPEIDTVGSFDSGIVAASWSPDDSYLILINGDGELLQMTPQFDVLHEAPLSTSDFGEEKQNALGWGSKSTQFHGSLGKSAAQASSSSTVIGSSPDDDTLPRISWRGDASFFCVSSLELDSASQPRSLKRRVIRVYSPSPDLTLHSTIEATPGLEHPLAWNASGSLIASTQRYGSSPPGLGAGREGRHDVVFFERNGLRRGGFELVPGGAANSPGDGSKAYGYHVKQLSWSCDSSILAVWARSAEGDDLVQLWCIGNYHWYLKQVIRTPRDKHYTTVMWHPEQALCLALTTAKSAVQIDLAWTTCASIIAPPDDTGTVVVADGESALITHFRHQNVPPPMCSTSLRLYTQLADQARQLSRAPRSFALAPHKDLLATLHNDDTVSLWDVSQISTSPRGAVSRDPPKLVWESKLASKDPSHSASSRTGHSSGAVRQIVIWSYNSLGDAAGTEDDWYIAVLASGTLSGQDRIYVSRGKEGFACRNRLRSSHSNGRLFVSRDKCYLVETGGRVLHVDVEHDSLRSTHLHLPVFCFDPVIVADSPSSLTIAGMSPTGRLFLTGLREAEADLDISHPPSVTTTPSTAYISLTLAQNATSFTLTPSFIVYTTTSHECHFVPIGKALDALSSLPIGTIASGGSTPDVPAALAQHIEKRRIERGSRIVVAVPSTMSLVLQMPRGNLETICPRPFVLEIVRTDVLRKEYRRAFLACRKHRIDIDVIVEQDFDEFMHSLGRFLDEVPEVDHINLFLTSIGRSSRNSSEINRICDGLRLELETRDSNFSRYIQCILTAHVVKTPPDLESALALLAKLQADSPDSVEDAVKYIIFLVDANTLFDTALGMYDFPLTLLIAQHSQRDPREYIPFLRHLRTLPEPYQRFSIDDHLKNHSKALLGLRDSGEEKFEEAVQYIEKHRLYHDALDVWKGHPSMHLRLQELYGDHLYDRREFQQAALVLAMAQKWRKALIAYEKSHSWKEAFALVSLAELDQSEVSSLASRLADDLIGRKRHIEGSRILLDYLDDVNGALVALVQGNDISEALRIATYKGKPELIDSIILPNVLTLREDIGEEIAEAAEQLSKQLVRYRELQTKKLQEPGLFYMEDDPLLHNVEMMTDAGDSVVSAFTRYTAAPTATSKASKTRTNKSRKTERKRGKKGTVDEEEYIVASFVKMVARLDHLQTECSKILPHLLVMSEGHKEECISLQNELQKFEANLQDAILEVWPAESDSGDGSPQNSLEPQKTNRPVIASKSWAISYLG